MNFQSFPPSLLILSPRLTRTGSPDASVEGLNTTTLGDGAVVYCAENKGEYQLDRTSTAVPDGNTVIAPTTGPGRWLLLAGGGGAGGPPWTVLKVVDVGTTVPVPDQNGSADFPYGTIQAAVDAGATRLMLVGGPSAENVVVPGGELAITVADFQAFPGAIASVTFSAPGSFSAQLAGRIGAITMPDNSAVDLRNCDQVGTLTLGNKAFARLEGTAVDTFLGGNNCTLVTDRDVDDATFGTSGTLMITGPSPKSNGAGGDLCNLGNVTMPGICTVIGANLRFDIGKTLNTGGYVELTAAQVDGDITCDSLDLISCRKTLGNVSCANFRFRESEINGGTITCTGVLPSLINTRCQPPTVFANNPAPGTFFLDGYSNYWIKLFGVPVAGSPASKVITEDLIP